MVEIIYIQIGHQGRKHTPSVWRELFNPNRDYTNIELERIARTIHAPYSHKNKAQLRASIVAKLAEGLPVEEKKQFEPNEVVPPEHPEFQQPAFIEQFNPQFRYYERFHKKTATFTNIPWDENTRRYNFFTNSMGTNSQRGDVCWT